MRVFGLLLLLSLSTTRAFEPLTVILPEGEFWSGQPIPVSLELRGRGRFEGTASFEIPEIPKVQWIRLGNPVLGSEQDAEGEIFLQRHDVALVSQQDGSVRIPPVVVRFRVVSASGQAEDIEARSEEVSLTVKRPPGVEPGQFVVSATDYQVTQTWSTQEERVDLGAVITRQVEQEVQGLSGMFLAPLPQAAPQGIRVYQPEQKLLDRENRGDLTGKRQDILRYRMERSGTVTLPAVVFRVWNPDTETLETHRVEGLTLKVKGALIPLTGPGGWLRRGLRLVVLAGLLLLVWRYRFAVRRLIPSRRGLPPLNPGR